MNAAFLLATIFLFCLATRKVISKTNVKPFQYKKIFDNTLVQWRDDFPTLARVVFTYQTPINLRVICGLAVGCDGKITDSGRICVSNNQINKEDCAEVGSKTKSADLMIGSAKMTVSYDAANQEIIGNLANIAKEHVLGFLIVRCESSASNELVWRRNNQLMVYDLRDGYTSQIGKAYTLSKDSVSVLSCADSIPKAGNSLIEIYGRKLHPIISQKVEYFLCKDTNWKTCYTDKSRKLGARSPYKQFSSGVIDTLFVTNKIPLNVENHFNNVYMVCFLDGVIAQPRPKTILESDTLQLGLDRSNHLIIPKVSGTDIMLWNDSSEYFFDAFAQLAADAVLEAAEWTYERGTSKIKLKNGEINQSLKVKVSESGMSLHFTGPYNDVTKGKYNLELKYSRSSTSNVLKGFLNVQVIAYPVASASFSEAQLSFSKIAKTISTCTPPKSSLTTTTYISVFNEFKPFPSSPAEYDTLLRSYANLMKDKLTAVNQSPVTINLIRLSDKSSPSKYIMVRQSGFKYKEGRESCFTINCQSIFESKEKKSALQAFSKAITVVAVPPIDMDVKLKSTLCIGFCEIECLANVADTLKRYGLKTDYKFEANEKLMETSGNVYKFTEIPHDSINITCSMSIADPASRQVLHNDTRRKVISTHGIIFRRSSGRRQTNDLLLIATLIVLTNVLITSFME